MKYLFFPLFFFLVVGWGLRPIRFRISLSSEDKKKYPLSKKYYEESLKRLNSKNKTISHRAILNQYDPFPEDDSDILEDIINRKNNNKKKKIPQIRIIVPQLDTSDSSSSFFPAQNKKSENFRIEKKGDFTFQKVGGYENIKKELYQCIDFLTNHTKYSAFNVRIPRGLIFEGPPGNGKTLLARAFAGESNTSFISVSGSEFQEKYVGVGASRIRELFKLASNNIPCVIFIDEIDALGRKRSSESDTASSEKDSTLNELLVAMDGFKNNTGIFVIGATNRVDLLDAALLRPGRIDKKIYIGNPDMETREKIIQIHLLGKPHKEDITLSNLVDLTMGFSGAQIENLLNEAMLNALRENRMVFTMEDIDVVLNKMIAGWQPFEHTLTNDFIERIAVHEMGHAVMGMLARYHSKVRKVIINLSSPTSPGYTLFEESNNVISTRETLLEHLAILLGGRIAEEVIYNVSITTGAINDFQEAYNLAEKMILYYGMGSQYILPKNSEKYKEYIDNEILSLILEARQYAEFIISESRDFIQEASKLLIKNKIVSIDELNLLIYEKYNDLLFLEQ